MPRRIEEDHHHSREDVDAYLVTALNILLERDLDPDDHDATLAALVNLLAAKQVFYEQLHPNAIQLLR